MPDSWEGILLAGLAESNSSLDCHLQADCLESGYEYGKPLPYATPLPYAIGITSY